MAEKTTVPPFRLMPPLNELAVAKVSVPEPCLVTAPAPRILPEPESVYVLLLLFTVTAPGTRVLLSVTVMGEAPL